MRSVFQLFCRVRHVAAERQYRQALLDKHNVDATPYLQVCRSVLRHRTEHWLCPGFYSRAVSRPSTRGKNAELLEMPIMLVVIVMAARFALSQAEQNARNVVDPKRR